MRRQEAALARRDTLAAVVKNKIPSITIGVDLGDKKHLLLKKSARHRTR
jgi:hypothetical protein